MLLAPDTNLLLHPTPRTLLHAVAIEQGHEILVLPEVYDEVMRGIRLTQAEKAQDIFKGLSNLGPDQQSEIAERMIASAQDWFTSELDHEETAYRRTAQTWQQAANAARMVRALPSGIAAPMPEPPSGDPLILAQALIHEATLLSTNNLNTIDHEQANAWARKVLGENRDFILSPDLTLQRLSGDSHQKVGAWVLSHVTRTHELPMRKRRGALWNTADALHGAGFIETARRLRWMEKTSADFRQQITADQSSHPQATRVAQESEARLRQSTKNILASIEAAERNSSASASGPQTR
ncbi:MAG: hypothetical protein OXH92_18460 [Bryobacterales bacterium]|nr:hypothetical protein [Gammaproteobacteria bacterium]MDE0435987.1 hypothetical protein [Bryobacterales bacterium]